MIDFAKFQFEDLFNPQYKSKFIIAKYGNYSPDSIGAITYQFKRLAETEIQKNKDIALFDKEELISLFEKNKWLSPGVVENKKSIIREYMRWYINNQFEGWENCNIDLSVDRISFKGLSNETIYRAECFRSFKELQDTINFAFDIFENVDDRELDLPVSIIYLAWFGVNINESVDIKKIDVSITIDQIWLPNSQRTIIINHEAMNFIREYLISDGYTIARAGNLTFCPYKETHFLLRSIKQEKLSEHNIRNSLYRFTSLYDEFGETRKFKYDRIRTSGIYSRLIEYEEQNAKLTTKDINLFEEYFRESYTESSSNMMKFYSRYKDFQKYREYCYSD